MAETKTVKTKKVKEAVDASDKKVTKKATAEKKVVAPKKAVSTKVSSEKKKEVKSIVDNIVIEQYTSSIRRPMTQRVQLKSLGLGRIGKRKVLPAIPSVVALVNKLKHLVRIVK